jgi:hypothetical protein
MRKRKTDEVEDTPEEPPGLSNRESWLLRIEY